MTRDTDNLSSTAPLDQEALLRRALRAVKEMRRRVSLAESRAHEPIAVIGIGCRFPGGASGPESYWRMLTDGTDAVREIPKDRWNVEDYYAEDPATPGRMNSRYGAFVDGAAQFDPHFFGISPREACDMDPQQRLLLEVSWEALERAGHPPASSGNSTGVFVGLMHHDYADIALLSNDSELPNAYTGSGNTTSIAAGRISFALGLTGPSIAVDTSCSSSLVTVQMAMDALRGGRCDLALAGGVNLILAPWSGIALSQLRALSPQGRCKTFDASADGFVRGEGCGMIALRRLSDALDDRDHIVAILRGAAVNHDGKSAGLTVPNGQSQVNVIRAALQDGGIDAGAVSYIEAHGTGTALGDPIEFGALTEVFENPNRPHPLQVGSVKTNIGHLESAAGIAGLIKAILCCERGRIPAHLHLSQVNPHIRIDRIPAVIPTQTQVWDTGNAPRIAGVSSFGFSGTNAHVVVEQPPDRQQPASTSADDRWQLLSLSATEPAALRAAARHMCAFLGHSTEAFANICYTSNVGRARFPWRFAVAANSAKTARLALEEFVEAADEYAPEAAAGDWQVWEANPRQAPVLNWLFPATARPGFRAIADLAERTPVFSQVLNQIDAQIRREADPGWPGTLTQIAQRVQNPAQQPSGEAVTSLAAQIALAELWSTWGVEPSGLGANGLGLIAAAQFGGMLPFADAVELAQAWDRAIDQEADPIAAAGAFGERTATLGFAAADIPINTDAAVCSSGMAPQGAPSIVDALTERLRQRIAGQSSERPSAGDGAKGLDLILGLPDVTAAKAAPADRVAMLDEQPDAWRSLSRCLVAHEVRGVALDWPEIYRGLETSRAPLPTYPFQRQRYWIDETGPGSDDLLASPEEDEEARPDPTAPPYGAVAEFYDLLSIAADAEHVARLENFDDVYLTMAPFQQVVPGFSWIHTSISPRSATPHGHLLVEAQREMRELLFQHVDWNACGRLLDIGCGYGTDLLTLADRFERLHLDGFTISGEQARIAQRRVAARQLDGRVHVRQADSASHEFPDQYDVVLGMEVASYVRSKDKLFSNINRHLADGGVVLLADLVSNLQSPIEHAPTSSHIENRQTWARQLADQQLRIVECVDATPEVANCLHDSENEPAEIRDHPVIRQHLESFRQTARLLSQNMAGYSLIVANKDSSADPNALHAQNLRQLDLPTSYADAVQINVTGDMYYEVDWVPQSDPKPEGRGTPGTWLLFADRGGVARSLANKLAATGCETVLVEPGEAFEFTPGQCALRSTNPEDYRRLLEHVAQHDPPLRGIVHPWAADEIVDSGMPTSQLDDYQRRACGSVLHLVQAMLSQDLPSDAKLWLVTRRTQSLGAQPELVEPAAASLWGLAKGIVIEHPDLLAAIVDIDFGTPEESAEGLMACLDFPPTHHEVMIRRGKHYTSRLIRSDLATSLEAPAALLSDRWYVISGGTGGLGRKVAGWMIERGARHVILLGRRDPSPEMAGELAALSEGDARVAFRRCDVSSFPEVQSVLQEARDELPLGGIIHAAGSLDDTLVRSMTWTQFEHAMSAKCLGAWNLHQATSNDALDLFVLFSSAASLLGSLGQANHCAANAFLDGLARYRRAAGLPAVSINWGAWSEIGKASELGGEESMKSRGIEALSPSDGLTALECVLASNKVQVGVVPVRWSQFRRQFPQAVPPFFSQVLGEGHTDAQRSSAKRDEALIARLREAPVRQRKDILIEYLQQLAASVLRTDAARLRDPRQPLHELGLDSLMGLELQNTIAARFGQNLSATLLINYPTLDALAGYLVDRIVDDRAESGRTDVTDRLPDIASAPPNPKPSRDSEEQPSHGDMLDRIEQMSDEQVESMLQNMTDLRLEPCPAGNSSNGSRNSTRRDCAS